MRGFLERAVDNYEGDGLLALTVPAPVVSLDTAIAAAQTRRAATGESGLFCWTEASWSGTGPRWALAGAGEVARVDVNGEERFDALRRRADHLFAQITERSHDSLRSAPAPRLFGGIAFRPEPSRDGPWAAFPDASFVLPRWAYGVCAGEAWLRWTLRAGETSAAETASAVIDLLGMLARAAEPSQAAGSCEQIDQTRFEVWQAMIADALERIGGRELEKIVPMALTHVRASAPFQPEVVLARLGALYPECVLFGFQRGDATFLGATPERLVARHGVRIEVDALAGSAARRHDAEDGRAAADLLESDKNRREHRVVVDAIRHALEPVARGIRVPAAPVIRTLHNVHHLSSPICATLTQPRHVLDLVKVLHPTPAVCGMPYDAALRWLIDHEPSGRGWYSGAVGWFDEIGDGSFAVAIRSGVLRAENAWLYAGAGIVNGSDAASEYAEILLKQAPMLDALGIV